MITDLLEFSCLYIGTLQVRQIFFRSSRYPQVVIRTVTTLPEITAVPVKGDFNCSRTGSLVQVRNMRSID